MSKIYSLTQGREAQVMSDEVSCPYCILNWVYGKDYGKRAGDTCLSGGVGVAWRRGFGVGDSQGAASHLKVREVCMGAGILWGIQDIWLRKSPQYGNEFRAMGNHQHKRLDKFVLFCIIENDFQ